MKRRYARRLLKIQDNINTDYVISGRYKFKIQNPQELAQHIFEDVDPTFASRIRKGDFLIAGHNFGCGSSREQAPQALKAAGIQAVIAKSFARIFYRNSINIGLPLVECGVEAKDGDEVEVDYTAGKVRNLRTGKEYPFKALPDFLMNLMEAGGLVEYTKRKLKK